MEQKLLNALHKWKLIADKQSKICSTIHDDCLSILWKFLHKLNHHSGLLITEIETRAWKNLFWTICITCRNTIQLSVAVFRTSGLFSCQHKTLKISLRCQSIIQLAYKSKINPSLVCPAPEVEWLVSIVEYYRPNQVTFGSNSSDLWDLRSGMDCQMKSAENLTSLKTW